MMIHANPPHKLLCVNLEISEYSFIDFKNDVNYRNYIKEQLAMHLARELIDAEAASFTYEPNGYVGGATVRARLKLL
jgi:hypothetical protein